MMDSVGSEAQRLYTLRNSAALRFRAGRRSARSELARRMWGEIVEGDLPADAFGPRRGWLLFDDGTERSLGIHVESLAPHLTPLSRYTSIIRTARQLKNVISNVPGIVAGSDLPNGWDADRFLVGRQPVWVAGPVIEGAQASDVLADSASREAAIVASSRVQIAVHGISSGRPRVGTKMRLIRCAIALSSGIFRPCVLKAGASGTIQIEIQEKGEEMEQREMSAGSHVGIPIRVDLGTIEIPLSTLEALVPGMVLELVSLEPSACFLQIGNRALAKGKLEITNEGVAVTVTKIFGDHSPFGE